MALTAATPRPARGRALLLGLASIAAVIAFVALLVIVVVVVGWIVLAAADALPVPDRKWPRLSAWAIVLLPLAALALAFFISHRAEGRTFYAQQSANRWISALLLVSIIGLLVALGEAIAATVTFDAYGALIGAALASVCGLGAAGYAHLRGPGAVLGSTRARRADLVRDRVLNDVVTEISIAANMPPPAIYVIDDRSPNAMAVGTNAGNAAIEIS